MLTSLKWLLAYVFIWRRKKKLKPTFGFDPFSKDLEKVGHSILKEATDKENPALLSDRPDAADTVAFWGVDNHGSVLVCHLSRRSKRTSDVWVYLRLPNGDEYQLLNQPDVRTYNNDGHSFSAAGLYFEVLEPLRTWRVGFSGLLRKGINKTYAEPGNEDTQFIRFNFIWHPLYCYMAMPDDTNISLLATIAANQSWPSNFLRNCNFFPDEWVEQVGQLTGMVIFEDQSQLELLLRGAKSRRQEKEDWKSDKSSISIKGYLKSGFAFHLYGDDEKGGLKNFVHGYVAPPSNYVLDTIKRLDMDVKSLCSASNLPTDQTIEFKTETRNFLLSVKEQESEFTVFCGEQWDCSITTRIATIKLNDTEGYGLVEYRRPHSGKCPLARQSSVRICKAPENHTCNRFVLPFSDQDCQNSEFVGGKGASLAFLSSLELNGDKYFVPPGVCLTNHSYQTYLQENVEMQSALKRLEDVAWKRIDGSLEEECIKVTKQIHGTKIPEIISQDLECWLTKINHGSINIRVAVRSSALGEDTAELSAAGQNESFLGISSIEEVKKAVIACWASQFSFRSVEYRRQNGQLIVAGMGVVIQEMVPAEVAGVLFSADPLTGNRYEMLITSNYGLGESVVSASVEPDTVVLKRSATDCLSVSQKQIGKKQVHIVMTDTCNTKEMETELDQAKNCSLSDEIALRLGEIALQLEKHFGSARDIEWAVIGSHIFLLQCRPVTSGSVLTDIEIMHEFDTSVKTDFEKFATVNLQEIMPGALTPLTLTASRKSLTLNMLKSMSPLYKNFRYDPTVREGLGIFYNHYFFDWMLDFMYSKDGRKPFLVKAMEVGCFGRVLDDLDDNTASILNERFGHRSSAIQTYILKWTLLGVIMPGYLLDRAVKKSAKSAPVILNAENSSEAYKRINDRLLDIEMFVDTHCGITTASTAWNLTILNILSGGTGEFVLDHYIDFAAIIGTSNGAESGDVPFSLKKLADSLAEEIEETKLTEMPSDEILEYLRKSAGSASEQFKDFITRHGHRGMREFEMQSCTWEMDPVKIIDIIKTTIKSSCPRTEQDRITTTEKVLADLRTPLSFLQRKLLSFVIPRSRKAVCHREMSKSLLIKYDHWFRLSFRRLGQLMVNEGFIPDENLLYYFTHQELGELLRSRSPRLIQRAKRRRQLYSYMDSMRFPEISIDIPKPVVEKGDENSRLCDATQQVKGYPVSPGIVQGIARVIVTLEEARTIEPGDILMTYATDIGWTPYFPLLKGLVTEIGGLISHGAVVAREYGLPCIVAAAQATTVFKTGEHVLLDATTGVVSKIVEGP